MNDLTPRPGFSPILNPLELNFDDPFELIPGHFIQRATTSQIPSIQRQFFSHAGRDAFLVSPVYECAFVEEQGGGRWEPMDQGKWRYNVISYVAPHGQSHHISDIELSSNVSDVPLDLPISFLADGGTVGYGPKVSHFLSRTPSIKSQIVTKEMLVDVRVAYDEFSAVRKEYPEIERAIRLFESLKALPHGSEFHLLGLFGIIEMLITRNPVLEDAGDSITHQMKGKVPLLAHRFRRPLDYSCFGQVPEEKVWAKLYAVRSNVAHGGTPDFSRGDLAVLKNRETATEFLRNSVRALIRHSFKEPLLYRDLKAC